MAKNSDFSSWTQKSSKWIFGVLVGIMAISLVVSFGSGGLDGCGGGGSDREAGSVFNKTVNESEFLAARRKTVAYSRWMTINGGMFGGGVQPGMIIGYVMRQGRWLFPDPKPAELDQKTFELIALKQYAGMCGLTVSTEEVKERIKQLCQSAQIPTEPEFDMEKYKAMVGLIFDTDAGTFENFVHDMLAIDKMLDLATDGPSVDVGGVVSAMGKDERKYRVQVASIDPSKFDQKIYTPGPDEVLKYYESHKMKFQVPEKYQVEFLFADVEKFKESQGEPTDDEMNKFYNDNKAKYTDGPPPHDPDHEGHDHEPPQVGKTKPFDEVKEDVRKQVKSQKAGRAAAEAMRKVNASLGDKLSKLTEDAAKEVAADETFKGKPQGEIDAEVRKRKLAKTGGIFGELMEAAKKENVVLTNDISLKFSDKEFDEIEKRVGKASDTFQIMSFVKSHQVGDFSLMAKTDKGSVIYRLNVKDAPYEPGPSGPIADRIKKLVVAEKRKEWAKKDADEIVKQIEAAATSEREVARKSQAKLAMLARLREQQPGIFLVSDYFKSNESGNFGLENAALASAVKTQITQPPPAGTEMTAGHTVAIAGDSVGGDKKDWGFVAVVDDIINLVPDEGTLWPEIQEAERNKRGDRRSQKIKEIVLMAAVVDKSKELQNKRTGDE